MKVIYLYEKTEAKLPATLASVRGWLQKPTLVTTLTIAEHNRAPRLIVRVFICAFPGFGFVQRKKNE